MNKVKRVRINKIVSELDLLLSKVETLRDEEQYAFDNMPENLQDSSKGEILEEKIDQLDDATDYLSDAIESLKEAAG
ncbi:MAG: hypothetical protein MJZ03_00465 [archaeon]|nr:hypothetical protein [archaeon]